MSFQKIAGISGIAFAVMLAANFLGQGSPPAVDSSQADIVRYLVDSGGGIKFFMAIAAALFAFSCGGLRGGVGAKWINYVGILGGVLGVIGGIWPAGAATGSAMSFAGVGAFIAFIIWAFVSGIEMLRAPAIEGAAA